MTMPIQFDTAQYIKRLVEAGIPREHAEALADGLQFALSQPVAGDADIAIWRADVQAMFTRSDAAMKDWVRGELARLEADMKQWVRDELLRFEADMKAWVRDELLRFEADMKAWVRDELARFEAEIKRWVMTKLRPVYWLLGVIVVQQTVIMAKLFL